MQSSDQEDEQLYTKVAKEALQMNMACNDSSETEG